MLKKEINMKGTVLFFLCVIAQARDLEDLKNYRQRIIEVRSLEGINENGCPKDASVEAFLPHENCDQFYQCINGVKITRFCPSGLHYVPKLEKCDWSGSTKKCRYKDTEEEEHITQNNPMNNEELDNTNPRHAYAICSTSISKDVLVAHEKCNHFYKCSYGRAIAIKCARNMLYNIITEKCDWPQKVECGDRTAATQEDNNQYLTIQKALRSRSINSAERDGSYSDPNLATVICALADSDGTLVAHEFCNQFYKCFSGIAVALKCPVDLFYNPIKESCDWPRNVQCGDRTISENDDNSIEVGNSRYTREGNDIEEDVDGGEGTGETGSDISEPSKANAICATSNSEGVLVEHEKCNQFYQCLEGRPIALSCPNNLFFNPKKKHCDWRTNVDCIDKPLSEKDDNDINDDNSYGEAWGPNSEPSQASSICASPGSDGVFVAHENCNQFYECHDGIPVALKCPGTLLYNISQENCDWPTNVECGDRLAPEKKRINDDNDYDNGSDDSEPTETSVRYSDSNDAQSICAGEESDGILVAHENCNQFYKCLDGKPVPLFCELNLLYDPNREDCDIPNNVDCGERIIESSDSSQNNTTADDTGYANDISCKFYLNVLTPYENCSRIYNSKPTSTPASQFETSSINRLSEAPQDVS